MSSNERPNILIFMPDQLRYDCIGAFGNKVIKTPNIDQLAANGTKFTNCFLQHSVCSQSRASIVTGKYPHVTGHRGLTTFVKPWEDNFFRTLKESGYHIASLGTRGDIFSEGGTELSVNEYGFFQEPSFSLFDLFKDVRNKQDFRGRLYYAGKRGNEAVFDFDAALIDSAEKWLDTTAKHLDKPWVLFLPLIFPHCPFSVEEPYFSMYDRSKVPKPLGYEEKTGYEPMYMDRIRKRHGLDKVDKEIWYEVIATYYGMVSRLDDQLGRVISKIDQDSTYQFFFTDHGEYLGDHTLIEKWPSGVSEQLVHEPLIIAGPGLPKGQEINALTEMVDLTPTLFEIANLPTFPYPHNGKSLIPLLLGKTQEHKNYVFSEGGFLKSEEPIIEVAPYPYDIKAAIQHEELESVGRVVAARDTKFTFVYRLYEKNELYDRENDIHEAHNLIDNPQYKDVVDKFEKVLLKWMVESSGHAPLVADPRKVPINVPKPGEEALSD